MRDDVDCRDQCPRLTPSEGVLCKVSEDSVSHGIHSTPTVASQKMELWYEMDTMLVFSTPYNLPI